jgi:hypothetical protein
VFETLSVKPNLFTFFAHLWAKNVKIKSNTIILKIARPLNEETNQRVVIQWPVSRNPIAGFPQSNARFPAIRHGGG